MATSDLLPYMVYGTDGTTVVFEDGEYEADSNETIGDFCVLHNFYKVSNTNNGTPISDSMVMGSGELLNLLTYQNGYYIMYQLPEPVLTPKARISGYINGS